MPAAQAARFSLSLFGVSWYNQAIQLISGVTAMMDEYFAVPISPSNKRAMAQMDALLAREGIERDRNLT